MVRHPARLVIPIALVFAAVLATPASAARLLSSSPVEGAQLSELDEVFLDFDRIIVDDGANRIAVVQGDRRIELTDFTFPAPETVQAPVTEILLSGAHTLEWSILTADGERNEGTLEFSINDPGQRLAGGIIAAFFIAAVTGGMLFAVRSADSRRRPQRG